MHEKGFPPKRHTEWGPEESIGDGTARTFATTKQNGDLKFLGVQFSADVLSGLPTEPPADWPEHVPFSEHHHLEMPESADVGAFEWLGMDWNPGGHEPPGIYTVPHFDFHFYTMALKEVESIEGGPATYSIPEDQMPEGYVRPPVLDTDGDGEPDAPLIVPKMGEHLMDPSSPEFNGESFDKTFIYGVYDRALLGSDNEGDGAGELIFMEPMITTELFETRQEEIATPIKLPAAFPEEGRYPTEYVIRYDGDADAYTVTLEGFRSFEASSQNN